MSSFDIICYVIMMNSGRSFRFFFIVVVVVVVIVLMFIATLKDKINKLYPAQNIEKIFFFFLSLFLFCYK
jgi:hypothetical protein